MLMRKIVLVLLVLNAFVDRDVEAFEPISGVAAAMAGLTSMMYGAYSFFKCRRYECCSHRWIINNSTGLKHDLQQKLYGQHLVINAVYGHIKGHVTPGQQPLKALVLSFHGWMGTGKNYVAKIIAENLYKEGMKSEFVHLISATKEFPHPERTEEYKDRIRKLIESSVEKCPQSLFIFDEMEKVPGGLIDTIRPYLQPYDILDGVDYRRAIFLFLGNIGGDEIARYALKHWREEKNREDIRLSDMEGLMEHSSLVEKGGLSNSELILNQLLTASVPFLPLNTTHVRQCIKDTLIRKHLFKKGAIPETLVDKVMANLHFQPESEKEKVFSSSGCKRVAEKVDFVVYSDY